MIKYCLFKRRYKIKGKNNKIIIVKNGKEHILSKFLRIQGLDIEIKGNNNIVKIELPIHSKNSKIKIGNDNVVVDIGTTRIFSNVNIRCCYGNKQFCKIGKDTTIHGANIMLDSESGLVIGEDCMLSSDIKIWCDDGHTILDAKNNNILNKPQGYVTIGNHVWIGIGALITKNTRIGNHCIIGGGAVAYKDYHEDNCIITGNPGKIVKREITWDRRNTYDLSKIENTER